MTTKRKRPQAPKSRSVLTQTMITDARARTFASAADYKRKPKHPKRGWDE